MSFWTMLMIKAHDGNGEAVAKVHIDRRCVEEAAETIPGLLHGETMLSAEDLMKVISVDVESYSYRSVHTVAKTGGKQ